MNPLHAASSSRRQEQTVAESSSDSLGRGMDIALTMLVFLGVGYLIDHWLGLFPLFTIVLVLFSAVGAFIRLKYTYDASMERLEAERLNGQQAGTA